MNERTTPPRPAGAGPELRELPIPDLGRMTFDAIDAAFQRGAIDAATLVRLQCGEPRGSALSASSASPTWDPQRAAATLLASVTAPRRAAAADSTHHAPEPARQAPEPAPDERLLVKATVLILLFVISAVAALSIAAHAPKPQRGLAIDDPALV
ncbi:MAG TPA: hypothetical protein VMG12_39435 [Polyangiaceae bacterium]|nr:hypothetical protein [Polyangiaceae bacterium]